MAAHQPTRRFAGPLARARGLGSAKEGAQHWWAQRVTAVALVPLTLWFVYAVIGLAGADQETVRDWLHRPANAILMTLLVIATFYHLALGLQVVVEDYVHREGVKIVTILLIKGLIVLLALSALFTILRVAVGG